jgi:hypothetical protein
MAVRAPLVASPIGEWKFYTARSELRVSVAASALFGLAFRRVPNSDGSLTGDSDPRQTQNHGLAGVVVAVMPVVVIGGGADPGAFEMAPPPATDQPRVLNWPRIGGLRGADGQPAHGEWHRHGSLVERGRQQQDGSR